MKIDSCKEFKLFLLFSFRFSYLNTSKRNPFSFIPFGVGQRDCFAQTYAKITVKTAVVTLLQKFRFSLSKKQMVS